MANPLCIDCKARGEVRQADEVDHEVPPVGRWRR